MVEFKTSEVRDGISHKEPGRELGGGRPMESQTPSEKRKKPMRRGREGRGGGGQVCMGKGW